jgi:putative transposase
MLSNATHVFSEIFFHLNWHCKHDQPMIVPGMEPALFRFLGEYCDLTKGVRFLEVGGTETHIHLLLQMEPHLCPADFVGKLKGASSFDMNKSFGRGALQWQRGYGIVSFAGRDLPALKKYVLNQKQHHAKGSTREKLEAWGYDEGESDVEG